MDRNFILAPSILSADFSNLERDIEMLNRSEADWIHIDIMDGVFVPNISFGFPVLKAIRKLTSKTLDVHLMITEPERYIDKFVEAGADVITIHYEASLHLQRTLNQIKESGKKAGVVLNPHSPVSLLENIIHDCDLVLLMSVNPGFAAQKFIPFTLEKIKSLNELISVKNPSCLIEIDGGISLQNAKEILNDGADILVAGNSVFSDPEPLKAISEFKRVLLA